MKRGLMNIIKGRKSRSSKSDAPSASSSRRHSVSESPRSMEEDVPAPRSDMLLLGGMRDTRSTSMRFTQPRGQADAPPLPPRRSTRSTAPPPYKPKISEYGFKIMSAEEEEKLKNLKGRLRANVEFDHQALQVLGFHGDVNGMLDNLGWRQFSEGINTGVQVEVAMEMLMTMHMVIRKVQGQDVPCLDFRLKDEDTYITLEAIGTLLGFQNGAPSECDMQEDVDEFWKKIAKDERRVRGSISNVIIRIFHSWMSKRIFGRMKEIKVIQVEVNWLYSALVGKQAINPTHLMVDRWLCEATSGSGEIGSGCYLTLIANFSNSRIERVEKFYLKGSDFGLSAWTQGHYIGGDEKKGFVISNTNITLPDPRLHLFAKGRKDWRDENLTEAKDKRRRNFGSTSAPMQEQEEAIPPASSEYWRREFQQASSGGVPVEPSWEGAPMDSSWGGAPSQAWGSGVPMNDPPPPPTYYDYGYGSSHYFAQGDPSFEQQYAHLPQPERGARMIGAYVDRTLENCDEMRRRADMVENDTISLAYQFGALGLVTPQQYHGGASQSYYEQGYYSTHPPYEGEGPSGNQE